MLMGKRESLCMVGSAGVAGEGVCKWVSTANKNGFFRVNMDTYQTEFIHFFNEKKLKKNIYYDIYDIHDKVYCIPHSAKNIAVYCKENGNFKYINLKEYSVDELNEKGFQEVYYWKSVHLDKYIYILGYRYPNIVRLDTESLEIVYIDQWITGVNAFVEPGDKKGYFSAGYVIKEDKLLLPLGCMSGVLELNLVTLGATVRKIEASFNGIGGIADIGNNTAMLVGRGENTNRIMLWNYENDTVSEIVIEDMSTGIWDPFYAPLVYHNKVYLFPIAASHIYMIDLFAKQVSVFDEVDKLISVDTKQRQISWKTMAVRLEGDIVKFISGHDLKWHEFNLKTKEYKGYFITCEDNVEEYLDEYYEKIYNASLAKGTIIKEENIPLENYIKQIAR